MKRLVFILVLFSGCTTITIPLKNPHHVTGSGFYEMNAASDWKKRDSLAVAYILSGNMPSFLKKFVAVEMKAYDSVTAKINKITIYVSPDYLSIGDDNDWARVPVTPMAAKIIADSLHCMLPTVEMVDAIYKYARVKLPPVPLFAFRDSTPTMYHHHLVIEGQRKGEKGLIGGIKKDLVQFKVRPFKK
jgi:hypothetical protein